MKRRKRNKKSTEKGTRKRQAGLPNARHNLTP
jgi:hypothetical protein